MANGFLCYHHHNDLGRQAVARCSKCGKALCQECTETFKSRSGAILCGECREHEVQETYSLLQSKKNTIRKEFIFIFVGLILGILATVWLANQEEGFAVFGLWLPFVGASFGTAKKFISNHSLGFITGFIMFLIFFLISPIVFFVRIATRIRHIKRIKGYQTTLGRLFAAYESYIKDAGEQTGENYYQLLQEQKVQTQALQSAVEESRVAVARKQQELEEAKRNNVSADVLASIQKQLDEQKKRQEEDAQKAAAMEARQAELEKRQEEQDKKQEELKGNQDLMACNLGEMNDRLNEM